MFVRRELIKISEQTIDSAKVNDLDTNGQNIIENSERLLFDLAEKGSFNSSLIKFDDAMKQTIEMASAAYKNEGGIVGVPTGLRDLDDKLGGITSIRFNYYCRYVLQWVKHLWQLILRLMLQNIFKMLIKSHLLLFFL